MQGKGKKQREGNSGWKFAIHLRAEGSELQYPGKEITKLPGGQENQRLGVKTEGKEKRSGR